MAFRCNPWPYHYGYLYFGTQREAQMFGFDHYGKPEVNGGWTVEAIDRAINAVYQDGKLTTYGTIPTDCPPLEEAPQ